MGSNISINCLSTIGCPRANLSIQLNSTARNETLRPLNSSAAQLRLHDFRLPYSTVLCFDHCRSREKKVLVCGTEVWAGCEYGHGERWGRWWWGCGDVGMWGRGEGGVCALLLTLPPQTPRRPPAT